MEISIPSNVADDLLSMLPLISRIIRKKFPKLPRDIHKDISPLHIEILKTLDKEGSLHVSEVALRLLIPRPQMTQLTDRLVSLGLVERQTGTEDRRTINVTLSNEGKALIAEIDLVVKSSMEETLSSLTEGEMQELVDSIAKLRELLFKVA